MNCRFFEQQYVVAVYVVAVYVRPNVKNSIYPQKRLYTDFFEILPHFASYNNLTKIWHHLHLILHIKVFLAIKLYI